MKPENHNFEIVASKKGFFASQTKLKNPYYIVTLFYTDPDDPFKDLSISIKPTPPNLNLVAAGRHIIIQDPLLQTIEPARAGEIADLLQRAAQSALALEQFLTHDFPQKGDARS